MTNTDSKYAVGDEVRILDPGGDEYEYLRNRIATIHRVYRLGTRPMYALRLGVWKLTGFSDDDLEAVAPEPDESEYICGGCGMRYVAPGATLCSRCGS